jgi:hypothetical protein
MSGIASLAKKVQAQGRGNDTILAHIMPQEAAMLKRMGGRGSVNPKTGLLEFGVDDGPEAGSTGSAGGNSYGGGTDTSGGPGSAPGGDGSTSGSSGMGAGTGASGNSGNGNDGGGYTGGNGGGSNFGLNGPNAPQPAMTIGGNGGDQNAPNPGFGLSGPVAGAAPATNPFDQMGGSGWSGSSNIPNYVPTNAAPTMAMTPTAPTTPPPQAPTSMFGVPTIVSNILSGISDFINPQPVPPAVPEKRFNVDSSNLAIPGLSFSTTAPASPVNTYMATDIPRGPSDADVPPSLTSSLNASNWEPNPDLLSASNLAQQQANVANTNASFDSMGGRVSTTFQEPDNAADLYGVNPYSRDVAQQVLESTFNQIAQQPNPAPMYPDGNQAPNPVVAQNDTIPSSPGFRNEAVTNAADTIPGLPSLPAQTSAGYYFDMPSALQDMRTNLGAVPVGFGISSLGAQGVNTPPTEEAPSPNYQTDTKLAAAINNTIATTPELQGLGIQFGSSGLIAPNTPEAVAAVSDLTSKPFTVDLGAMNPDISAVQGKTMTVNPSSWGVTLTSIPVPQSRADVFGGGQTSSPEQQVATNIPAVSGPPGFRSEVVSDGSLPAPATLMTRGITLPDANIAKSTNEAPQIVSPDQIPGYTPPAPAPKVAAAPQSILNITSEQIQKTPEVVGNFLTDAFNNLFGTEEPVYVSGNGKDNYVLAQKDDKNEDNQDNTDNQTPETPTPSTPPTTGISLLRPTYNPIGLSNTYSPAYS